ncbi:MAG: nuclear transport factor 2 family protein [Rubrivivax sp.]
MSDPLTLVQSAYAAFGRGDLPALLALMTPDIDWRFVGDRAAPYTGHARGQAQLAEWFGAVAQADDIQAFEPRQMLAGPDHVTVIGWERSLARATGRPFECEWVHVWTVRDGRIAGFVGLLDSEASARARA